MPKSYGTPTGYQAPDPKRRQKAATAATAAQTDAYMSHMIAADKAYHAKAGGGGGPASAPTGTFAAGARAVMNPKALRDKQIKEAGG
jgi:hypothetical protein